MKRSTILLVEDENPLRALLRLNLRGEGYRVLAAATAERGLALFKSREPDLIVLDVTLPGMDGFELCRRVRQSRDVPILFLTAKKSEVDKVLGLKLGGDDFVTKPFSLPELLARIEALDRRANGALRPNDRILSARGVTLDPDAREAMVRGKPILLCPKEFELLRLFLSSKGRIFSREQLMKKVWGYERSMKIETRTVDQHVALLRKKLRPEQALIETVSKGGYRLRAPRPRRRA